VSDPRLARLFPDPVPLDRLARIDHPKEGFLHQCANLLKLEGDRSAGAVGFFVPGRIEVFGKHTDYCGGRSLLCAVDRGFAIVARPRRDGIVRVIDVLQGERCEFVLSGEIRPPLGHWSNYPMTVARRILKNFPGRPLAGADIAFASDLPVAAGLSSSSAFIIGTFLALAALNGLHETPEFTESIRTLEDFAHYGGCIENGSGFRTLAGDEGVGTSGGSQDHTAILCCKAGFISQFGFSPVVHERDVAFPRHLAMVVLNSGVVAEKTGSARARYNAVSQKVRLMVELWNRATGQQMPTLASIVRSGSGAVEELRRLVESAGDEPFAARDLIARLEQFVEESERTIPRAGDALANGDLDCFARLVERSTAGAVEKLANQVPETIALLDAARAAGALAASPFGAGFGGSVWSMVDRDRLDGFVEALRTSAHGVHPVAVAAGAEAVE